MRQKKIIKGSLTILFLMLGLSFKFLSSKNHKGKLTINISHFVGSSLLKIDSVRYLNTLGQDFNVTKFKYYIGNIILTQANGNQFKHGGYFLIDEETETSKHLNMENIPVGKYSSLEFTIGVDSSANCSGAQSGALDPANAMFWAWNTGYIFLKMEGSSPYSKSPAQMLEYHIGGYRHPNNCIRKVKIGLSNAQDQNEIKLKVDLLELLRTPADIDFSKLSSVTDFHNATLIADNYKDMFRVMD